EGLLIVDPSAERGKLIQEITRLGKKSAAILLTHTHYDHIGAVEELRDHYQIPLFVSPLEQAWLSNPILNSLGLARDE
ncbi:MBL fold metallo-hydrolase, partial [Enterococcus faecalis]|uniref:MBL fold metallo-hydrolase n=1 Tax=Enterococcus faecalis TaxID=1351 RepID=UPI003D6BDF44